MKKLRGVSRPYEQCHKVIDDVMYKLCSDCNEWIQMDIGYYKNKSAQDGYNPYCKECTKKRSFKWTKNNPDRYKKSKKKYLSKSRSKLLVRKADEKARKNGKRREWQQEHKDKISEYNQYRNSNKKHNISKDEWNSCLDYFEHSCAYCGINENAAKETQGNYLHKEHVIHNGENDLSNCVPACKSCNSKKNTFILEEWYREDNPLYDHFSIDRLRKIYKWLNEEYVKYIDNK